MSVKTITLATLLASSVFAMPGHAGVFVEGSTFTVSGANTPGNVSAAATITDNFAQALATSDAPLVLTVQETPDGAGGEWIGFHYSSSPTLVRNSQAPWNLSEIGLLTNQATNFVGSFLSFDLNGVVQAQTSCTIWGPFSPSADPSGQGGGAGCLATGFTAPFAAGALPSLGTTTGSHSFNEIMADVGISNTIAGALTSYTEILDFRPQVVIIPPGVPEPASLGLLGVGLLGLGAVTRYTRRS